MIGRVGADQRVEQIDQNRNDEDDSPNKRYHLHPD